MDISDDFELLGRAVARVLREAFATAADVRAGAPSSDFAIELDALITEMRAMPAKAQEQQRAEAEAFASALAAARADADAALQEARDAADAIRLQAVADARSIVEGAAAEVDRSRQLVADERARLDAELKTLVGRVHRSVDALETASVSAHSEMLERATSEARMILRQARLHHRSTAREVDRMIEAAAAEAAQLRRSALADAARVAARVRGVVELPEHREDGADAAPGAVERRFIRRHNVGHLAS